MPFLEDMLVSWRVTTWDVNNPVTSNWINYTNLKWLFFAGFLAVLVAIQAAWWTFPKTPKRDQPSSPGGFYDILRESGNPKKWGPLFAASPSRRSPMKTRGAPGAPGIHPDEWVSKKIGWRKHWNWNLDQIWWIPSLKLTIFAPENGWLEYDYLFPVGFRPIFRGKLAVSFTEGKYLQFFEEYKLIHQSNKSAPLVGTQIKTSHSSTGKPAHGFLLRCYFFLKLHQSTTPCIITRWYPPEN